MQYDPKRNHVAGFFDNTASRGKSGSFGLLPRKSVRIQRLWPALDGHPPEHPARCAEHAAYGTEQIERKLFTLQRIQLQQDARQLPQAGLRITGKALFFRVSMGNQGMQSRRP